MILRHVTLKKNLKQIYEDGCLDSTKTLRKRSSDKDYVSFELEPSSDVLVRIFPMLKSNLISTVHDGEQFELLFDGEKMLEDGIQLERVNQSKIQLKAYQENGEITQEEYYSIGEFVLIKGKVSLKYLTDISKDMLEEFINENNSGM
ncbi:hypothetical protein [Clostridium sp.]|uniref:hypothetical protein n=1 Tax=Clostridium sp. TaxID=1506 RepID=UPI00290CFD90|nr:hypothetical protein [Clostridium sp.]MDU4589933.1 hypothetical protein [Clostridium sp.]